MDDTLRQLEQAIAALESQRSLLGDAVVEAGLAPMRERLALLQTQAVATEQRKLVTVLFADVVGFTSLAERLDAEELHEHLQALWQPLDRVVFDHGGQIDKHMGDGLMALWGSAQAREDDPERAIRAALAMQSHLAQRDDATTRLRVGISSGPVLVGALGTVGEVTVLGDTVNLASRLEHAAPPGGVLIAHDTYRHVRGLFDVEVLPPLAVRGKREPVQVYLVKAAKPRAFFLGTRGVEGVETEMVGRESELARLQSAYQGLYEQTAAQAITIVGEAGLGKSRLLYEFLAWAELQPRRITLFKGRAAPEMLHLPYALLRNLFAFRYDIQESDEPLVARQKLEAGLLTLLGDRSEESLMRAHFVGQLLGFDFATSPHLRGVVADTQQVRQRALAYMGQLFAAVARQTPLLVVLEDLHWADDATLDAFIHLLNEMAPAPILVLALARPTLFERRPTWGNEQPHHSLVLQPLSPSASRRLVEDILRHIEAVPDTLRELVVGGAEGNPFYIEELIKMLIEAGAIVRGGEVWRVVGEQLGRTQVPATLAGVLQARLDALPVSERGLLQRAAVIGRVFWDDAAAALHEAVPSSDEEGGQLAALRQRELVFRRDGSAFVGTTEYTFKHALLRDVAYEGTLKRQRRAYHARAARWLVGWGESRAQALAGLIAEHYAQAGELEQAAPWYLRAAQQAQAAHDAMGAIRCYEQVMAHGTPTERLDALMGLGHCCETTGAWDQAEGHYREALTSAEAESDGLRLARAYHVLGYLRWSQGNSREGLRFLEEARRGYQQVGDTGGVIRVLITLGEIHIRLGEYQSAKETLALSLTLAREQADWQGVGDALHYLGSALLHTGNDAEARTLYEESLALRRASGDRQRISATLGNLVRLHLMEQAYEVARQLCEENLVLRKEVGSRYGIAIALGNLGSVTYLQGRYAEARSLIEQGLALARELGAKPVMVHDLNLLGNVALAEDDRARAIACHREGLTLAGELGNQKLMLDCLIGTAGTLTLEPTTPIHCEQAGQLLAVAERYLAERGAVPDLDVRPVFDEASQIIKHTLAPARLVALQAITQDISLDESRTLALQFLDGLASSAGVA